jgi:hypothetical protein
MQHAGLALCIFYHRNNKNRLVMLIYKLCKLRIMMKYIPVFRPAGQQIILPGFTARGFVANLRLAVAEIHHW